MIRSHPAARDRSPQRHALYRSHADTQFFFSGELHAALEGEEANGIGAGSCNSYLDLRQTIRYLPIHGASICARMSLLFSSLRGVGGIA